MSHLKPGPGLLGLGSGPRDSAGPMNLERLRDRFFEGAPRYKWIETIGRGGMGIVFKADDLELEEVVAIKVLSPDWESDDQQLLTRFKREINLNRKIKHPNVARIHDFGMSGDFPFITMEFVPGTDLRTLIQGQHRIPPTQAISILRQIALGSEAAHKLGIIHRDLKSQNVMVEESGAVAILDFGLARGKQSVTLTLDSVMVGTPHYMSPEQALGRPTDARSDVYSIGVMGYEMLTGKVPFDGESPLVIAMKHVSEPIPDELSRFPDVSPEFQGILLRALAKDPEARFASAADLEAELAMLRPFVPPPGVTVPVPGPPEEVLAPSLWEPTPVSPPPAVPPPGTPAPAPPAPKFSISSASIPAVSVPSTPTSARAAPTPPRKTRPPVVLVVDDDAAERKQLGEAVSRYGCEFVECPTGEKALDLLLREDVDLVLMSAVLPGMDGFDVTRVLKSQPATTDLPVVLISSRLDRGHFAFAIQSGATDFLMKPVKTDVLVGRLWHILEHHGFAPPPENQSIIAAMKRTLRDAATLTPPSSSPKR